LNNLEPKKDQTNVEKSEQRKVTTCDANVQTNAANVVPDVYKGATALPVVAVVVRGPDGQSKSTYALLDQASEATFIHSNLAKDLNLKGTRSTLSIKSLTGSTSINAEKVTVTVEAVERNHEDSKLLVRDVIVTDNFDVHLKVVPRKDNLLGWKHLSDVNFPEVECEEIQMLIGADNPAVFITEQVRVGGPGEPWAFKYKLGWALMGPTNCERSNHVDVHLLQRSNTDSEELYLKEQVSRYFKADCLGVVSETGKVMSIEDRKALKMMEESATIVDNHYEVGMLWSQNNPQLPNNRYVAFKRLQHLKNRLKKDEVLHQKYREKIEEYVKKEYARKLRPNEASSTSVRRLPPSETWKICIVFDAAAKFEDTSLNDNLLQGPNLTNKIVDVLIRFRKEKIAVVADIQEMFHQIKVPEKDRDSLRFLWLPSDLDDAPETYHMNVHIFGAKDSPSIANFALRKTAKDNSDDFSQSAVDAIEKDFYVDDLLKSLPNEQAAIGLSSKITELLQRGGFCLTKFMSSSKKVLAAVPASERANPSFNLNMDKLPVERALGMIWNFKADAFEFKVIASDKPETKRGILSTVASLYDALGLAAPVTLLAKCQLQRLWQLKIDWNAQLPDTELVEWRRWKSALPALSNMKIPRCYKSKNLTKTSIPTKDLKDIQLHNFSDASEIGYGVSSYIRITFIDGTVVCALVFCKSRAAPLQRITIPRLELQAAVLSVRFGEMIQREIEIKFDRVCYWTDSEIVLKYIQKESKRYTVYVGNRIAEIREKSELSQWRYCPTKKTQATTPPVV
jgi:hypothetical protein